MIKEKLTGNRKIWVTCVLLSDAESEILRKLIDSFDS